MTNKGGNAYGLSKYSQPETVLTNQLTKSIKKLPEISLKTCPLIWLKS